MLMILLDLLLGVPALVWLCSVLRAIIKRTRFLIRIAGICGKHGYTLRSPRPALASFFRASSKPDLIIHTPACDYHLRFITCIRRKKFYHFISENAYATHFRLGIMLPMAKETSTTALFARYHELPAFDSASDGKPVQSILLFNPLPVEITRFDEKSGTEPATNGVKIGRFTVYDASRFTELLADKAVSSPSHCI